MKKVKCVRRTLRSDSACGLETSVEAIWEGKMLPAVSLAADFSIANCCILNGSNQAFKISTSVMRMMATVCHP